MAEAPGQSRYNDSDDREMSHEEDARLVVEQILEKVDFDELRGIVRLWSGVDHRFNSVVQEFESLEDVRQMLVDKAEAEWINSVPWDNGPVWEPDVETMVDDKLEAAKVTNFFYPSEPYAGEELFTAKQLLGAAASAAALVSIEEITAELISYFAKNPEKMRNLPPRKFEELVAELFKNQGFDIELTPPTNDGGFDIRAFRKEGAGIILALVECKRFSEANKVGVDIVRALHGVVDSHRATYGIIATTSTFTRGAHAERSRMEYRMQFADFQIIQGWLSQFRQNQLSQVP